MYSNLLAGVLYKSLTALSVAVLILIAVPLQRLGQRDTASAQPQLPDTVFVYKIVPPDVSEERVRRLALEGFGFQGRLVETEATLNIVEEARPGRFLTVYKVSGVVAFVDETKYKMASYSPTLPSESEAKELARTFLLKHGLLPPQPSVAVFRDNLRIDEHTVIPNAIAVSFRPRLAVAPQLLVPVDDGEVIVWLGHQGEVIRCRAQFRKVESLPILVPLKFEQATLAEARGLTLTRVYVTFEPHEEQPYLDPVIEAVLPDGTPIARTPATSFTPRLIYLDPDPSILIPSTSAVTLRATANEGTPPYKFRWFSNRDGFLGEGDGLDTQLSPGKHRIDVRVRDAKGAGVAGSQLLEVVPPCAECPPEDEPPGAEVIRFTGKAHGVGSGNETAGLAIVGRFTSNRGIDLAASTAEVRIARLLDEKTRAGEVVDELPFPLSADPRNNGNVGIFKTPAGELPIAEMTIGALGRGRFNFRLDVSKVTVDVPSQCPTTDLTTTFTIDDGINPPVVVTTEQPWRCFGTGNRYMRTP